MKEMKEGAIDEHHNRCVNKRQKKDHKDKWYSCKDKRKKKDDKKELKGDKFDVEVEDEIKEDLMHLLMVLVLMYVNLFVMNFGEKRKRKGERTWDFGNE